MAASRIEIGLLYVAAVVQGLALVTFPAASGIFTSPGGFGFSASQYGTMFVPQVILAVLISGVAPKFAARWGLKRVLLLGLAADLVSMALLASSPLLQGTPTLAFLLLCAATGALGFGFGATVMALNTFIEAYFPARADGAVLTLNALLGVGTALAPLLVAVFVGLGVWWALPLMMVVLVVLLLGATARQGLQPPSVPAKPGARPGRLPARFWLYAAAVLLYGIAETLNGNWATLYLSQQRHVSAQGASFALTAFWVMVTLGRVIVAFVSKKIPARWIYVALPLLLLLTFQAASLVDTEIGGILAFGAAGLACSAMLPLSISFGGGEFPRIAAVMSGELIAFYQVGYGIAAFGTGPLKEFAGLSFAAMFSWGSLVALALAATALLIVRHQGTASAQK